MIEFDHRLGAFLGVLQERGLTAAYRLLHEVIRDAWENVGVEVTLDSGLRHVSQDVFNGPVKGWHDAELDAARHTWHYLRRRRKSHPELHSDCQRARRAYEKLRAN